MNNNDEILRQRISNALNREVEYGERLDTLFEELLNLIDKLKEETQNGNEPT